LAQNPAHGVWYCPDPTGQLYRPEGAIAGFQQNSVPNHGQINTTDVTGHTPSGQGASGEVGSAL